MDKTMREVYGAFLEFGDHLVICKGKKAAQYEDYGGGRGIYIYSIDYDCDQFIIRYGVFDVFI